MLGPEVMLATPSAASPDQTIAQLDRQGWWFEIKFDGIRAVVRRDSAGEIKITNRRRVNITHRYPDVVEAWRKIDFVGVLDGEIIVADDRGRPSFSRAHLRDAQGTLSRIRRLAVTLPATFMPFDALESRGRALTGLPYIARRETLAGMVPPKLLPIASRDGATIWSFVQEHGLEGLIAKRGGSLYRPGRSKAWVKVKQTHRVSVIVGGIIDGNGSRDVGALQMYLWEPSRNGFGGELRYVGNVGSGLKVADERELRLRMQLGTPVVVEVEYLEVSPDGQLRMPTFKGVRTDMAPEACTVDTLAAVRA